MSMMAGFGFMQDLYQELVVEPGYEEYITIEKFLEIGYDRNAIEAYIAEQRKIAADEEYAEGRYEEDKKAAEVAEEEAQDALDLAKEQRDIALEEARDVLTLAEERYDDSLNQLERSRVQAHRDIIRQEREASNVAAGFSRGGSSFSRIERGIDEAVEDVRTAVTDERSRLRREITGLRNKLGEGGTVIQSIQSGYGSALDQYETNQERIEINRQRSKDAYEHALATGEYNATMLDINTRPVDINSSGWLGPVMNVINAGLQIATGIPNVLGLFTGGMQQPDPRTTTGGGYGSPGVNPYGNYWGL